VYSPSFFPFRSEKLIAAVAESASALTLQEPDLDEILDPCIIGRVDHCRSTSRAAWAHWWPIDFSLWELKLKLVAGAVESLSRSSEGSTTASPQSVLDNTTDGSASSASSLGSKILIRSPRNWYQVFYRGIILHVPKSGLTVSERRWSWRCYWSLPWWIAASGRVWFSWLCWSYFSVMEHYFPFAIFQYKHQHKPNFNISEQGDFFLSIASNCVINYCRDFL
jgi:hypothetical protein